MRHFLVAGAQRSGTTYLHRLLEAHPAIAMARPARPEPKVFCSDRLTARGADWYRSTYFAHVTTERLLGEKSTSYLEDPRAATRAVSVLGPVEVLVLLRDPLLRAVSNWRFSTDNGLEQRPLEAALEENLRTPRPWDPSATSVSPYAYLERGRYADYLDPWYEAVPGRVHVHFLAELVHDGPAAVYGDLGVDPAFAPAGTGDPVNQSTEPAPEISAGLVERIRAYHADSDTALRRRLGRAPPWPTQG